MFQVRSNSRGATGFVGQRQRLCVLLTRARRELKEFPLGVLVMRMEGHEVLQILHNVSCVFCKGWSRVKITVLACLTCLVLGTG